MKKRLLLALVLIGYIAILIKIIVFKDVPTLRVGQLMLNFGGTDTGHAPNFVPFKTILPYLLGYKGWIIAGINLFGNIALLVPVGFFLPLLYPNITWKKSLVFAFASGLVVEILQVVLRVGIFDIDDVILNALGVMIGYWACILFAQWVREKRYMRILIAVIIIMTACAGAAYTVYPHGQPVVGPGVSVGSAPSDRVDNANGGTPQNGDLCGGTGGNGQIVGVGNGVLTMKRKDGTNQTINLVGQVAVKTSAGSGSIANLKIGDSITIVGGPNSDGSFTAEAVFVCSTPPAEVPPEH